MDLQLAGRAYYVTGGSRGVGRAIVELLLAEGAYVSTCARDIDALSLTRRELPSGQAERLLAQQADVRDRERMAALVADAVAAFGRLDGVVANAGAGVPGTVLGSPAALWHDQLRSKVHGVLNLVRPAVTWLAGSDAGRVVLINGVTARVPEPSMAAVSAARAAVLNLGRTLAVQLAPRICVTVVNLGAILTARQHARFEASGSTLPFEDWCTREAHRRGVLLGRLGTPAEVAPMVALLLSPRASYITGISIDIAGGSGGIPTEGR
jgi:NAD(P)-dependent dehydrogenase (short-subunit alcohol dehydrogenase family)